MDIEQKKIIEAKLYSLRVEHRDLDDVIGTLSVQPSINQIQIQRLKKRKLMIKDEMSRLEGMMIPNIIA